MRGQGFLSPKRGYSQTCATFLQGLILRITPGIALLCVSAPLPSQGLLGAVSAKPSGKQLQDQIHSVPSILDEKSYKEVTYYYVTLQRSTPVFVLS